MLLIVSFNTTQCGRSEQPDAIGQPLRTDGAPTPEELTRTLGVRVDAAPGETNQYLIRAPQGSVDLTKLGKIHTDLGYAVGVTLPNGVQIGLRYEPLAASSVAVKPSP